MEIIGSIAEHTPSYVLPRSIPLKRYTIISVLGRGSQGCVYAAKDNKTNELVAIKKLTDKSGYNALMQEITLLQGLRHRSIVSLIATFTSDEESISAVIEYADGGALSGILRKCGRLEEPLASKYIKSVLKGLAYIHEKGIVHRDIKSANVLIKKEKAKLADFGISVVQTDTKTKSAGTLKFMSPECLTGQFTSNKTDIWSVGALTIELLKGKPPFDKLGYYQILACYGKRQGPHIPKNVSESCSSFIQACLEFDPANRPTALQLLSHPWIQKLKEQRNSADLEEFMVFLSIDAYFNSYSKKLVDEFRLMQFEDIDKMFIKHRGHLNVLERMMDPGYRYNAISLALESSLSYSSIAHSFITCGLYRTLKQLSSETGLYQQMSILSTVGISLSLVSGIESLHDDVGIQWIFEYFFSEISVVPFVCQCLKIETVMEQTVNFLSDNRILSTLVKYLGSPSLNSFSDHPFFIELSKHTLDQLVFLITFIAKVHQSVFIQSCHPLIVFLTSEAQTQTIPDNQIITLLQAFPPDSILEQHLLPTLILFAKSSQSSAIVHTSLSVIHTFLQSNPSSRETASRSGLMSLLPRLLAKPSLRSIATALIRTIH